MKAATTLCQSQTPLYIISIHAAREGGDLMLIPLALADSISIHAAREGGDLLDRIIYLLSPISIHAAREGGDHNPYTPQL